ncbi:hypothetical protein OBBRIDRAFT_791097 [Obba rivulosa]|uniref:DUF323 domain-containing protein n=1 Tax=Obba rivulosa TaxID=1052685 RepID=A0A8E2DMU8_9APHY|nr:hypothetical protein OBBRIDRAFT_791097 [Obba rivulosa]
MATSVDILDVRDVRGNRSAIDTRADIVHGLSQPAGKKWLPTMLLYDDLGLRLYDDITTEAPEYYLFSAEENILKNKSGDIVRTMHAYDGGRVTPGEVVVELGAGSLRKTSHILRALSGLVPTTSSPAPVNYFALDLEKRELDRTLSELSKSEVGRIIHRKVSTKGMCGTYDDGLQFIQEGGLGSLDGGDRLAYEVSASYKLNKPPRNASPSGSSGSSRTRTSDTETDTDMTSPSTPDARQPLHILFLGSSLGNFERGEDVKFLRSLPIRPGSGDTLLLGLDQDNEKSKIEIAYDDPKGITKKFIMNGLKAAGRLMGDENLFDQTKWEYVGRYNEELRRHEAYYKSVCKQTIRDPSTQAEYLIDSNELVRIEVSHKYSDRDVYTLFTEANLRPIYRWLDSASQYSLWLLECPQFSFPLLRSPALPPASQDTSPFGVPRLSEWQNMWVAWDFITQRMISPSMLFQKPIDLRHICLFYCGHIPTFLSIHLARALNEPDTEPVEFKYIFERGIDPNVNDPTQCHPHSEVPTRNEDWPLLSSILDFQARVRQRVLALYADIDAGKIVLTRKLARMLFMTHEHEAFHAETLLYMLLQRAGTGTVPPSGFSPPTWDVLAETWDSAPPPKVARITLGPATVELGHDDNEADDDSTDVAGHTFGWDNEYPRRVVDVSTFEIETRPITNGEFYEFYKEEGRDIVQFPVSWIEIEGEVQVRTLYGPVSLHIAKHWPVITSFDNLSKYASVKGGRIPTEPELRLFLDRFDCGYEGGANIGFRNWHPVPATTGGERNEGKGHNGGVWEWTSTVLERHEGFVPSRLYPGYSTDFFDGQHHVVIGGSYATIPRLAERRTLRNYYQHNYPYAWVGARIAYDARK